MNHKSASKTIGSVLIIHQNLEVPFLSKFEVDIQFLLNTHSGKYK